MIVRFPEPQEDWKISEVICVKCCKRWIATRPTGVYLKQLECENCGTGCVIETGEEQKEDTNG